MRQNIVVFGAYGHGETLSTRFGLSAPLSQTWRL
jgi:hypothetical protein